MAEEGEFMVTMGADRCRWCQCCVDVGRCGSELVAESDAWSRMVSVLGFVTWSPVHMSIGICTTVTLFKF